MGYVYVIKMGDTNYHKIGITEKEPNKRLSTLQTGNPFPLRFMKLVKVRDMNALENLLHYALREYGALLEWFNIDFLTIEQCFIALTPFMEMIDVSIEELSKYDEPIELENDTSDATDLELKYQGVMSSITPKITLDDKEKYIRKMIADGVNNSNIFKVIGGNKNNTTMFINQIRAEMEIA